jgi:hypothetical protein
VNKLSRILAAVSGFLLAGVFAFPLWRIGLIAPQYPEGLGMVIGIRTVRGAADQDLNNINELNHYIGMKIIDPAAIPELRWFPWIAGALVAGLLIAAAWGRRGFLYAWVAAFAVAAAAGMWDFWRWTWDYGHNLDMEHAIIKVPGAIYQPPIFGTRQILNFTASSWPGIGGWLAFLAFAVAAAAVWTAWRERPASTPRRGAAVLRLHRLGA